MKPSQYSTIMPTISLESQKFIDIDLLIRLIGRDLDGIFSFLASTSYREEIVNTCGDRVETGLLEEALYKNYAKTFNKLLKNSSKYIKKFLESFLHKFDAMNLKTMFRMVQAGRSPEDILQYIVPLGMYNKEKCQKILSEFNTINEIIDSLQEQDFGFFLREVFSAQKIVGDLTTLEAILDKEVFIGILKKIKNLNRLDRKIATNILGIEIDTLNVKIILKYQTLMTNHENIAENLMPSVLIDKEILAAAIKESNITKILHLFLDSVKKKHPIYQKIFTNLVNESNLPLSRLEFILEKAPFEMSLYEMKENMRYYNIGYILTFLNMKWVEIKNLICIINAMARNFSLDKTRNLLILPEST